MSFEGLYNIRPGISNDFNFVLATFLKGLYYGDSWFSLIPRDIFMENYKHIVKALLEHPNTMLVMACLKDDPDITLGYSLLSKDGATVHWIYVKKAWRKKGIGKSLLPKSPKYVSHLSELGKSLLTKINNPQFNPFSLG
jgi:GNAT superfamily N-acetyltransferase